ncbi:MAG: caspase family protein [Alphaproteobacteria bacterium]|nr:caspase family protein [Alphaproteobacteria bacterium]
MKHLTLIFLALLWTTVSMAQNKALLIGVGSYEPSTGWKSIGSYNDVDILSKSLSSSFRITTLTNEKATYNNIITAINQLINNCKQGDTVLIHFSGHGQQMLTTDKNEPDGLDEALVPYDAPMLKSKTYNGERHLTDNQVGVFIEKLRKKVGENGLVVVTIDACFSDSMHRDGDDDSNNETIGYRGGADFFGSNTISEDSIKSIYSKRKIIDDSPMEKIEGGANVALISACESFLKSFDIKVDGINYGPLSYAVAQSFLTHNFSDFDAWMDNVDSVMKKTTCNQQPKIRTTLNYSPKTKPAKSSLQTGLSRSQESDNEGFPYILIIIEIATVALIIWKISSKK